MSTTVTAEPLSTQLRAGTRAIHLELERSAFMQALLKGQLERSRYALFLRSLFALYTELEGALARAAENPVVAAVFQPELRRADRLAADLLALHGAGWRDELEVLPAAVEYGQHLRELAARSPVLLSAHVYVRSLGDLSGGQLVRKIVAETLHLGPEARTFYDFGSPEETQRLTMALRGAFGGLQLGPSDQSAIIEEAVQSFARHQQLFTELCAAALPEAVGSAG